MKVDEKIAEEVMDNLFDILGRDFDFRFNAIAGKMEYDINHYKNWKSIDDKMMSFIKFYYNDLLKENFSTDFLKECFKTAPSIRFSENTKAVFERRKKIRKLIEFLLHVKIKNKASEFIQAFDKMFKNKIEFRYNVFSKEIEVENNNSGIWEVANDVFLLYMKKMVFPDSINYTLGQFKLLFSKDPSIRYEGDLDLN